MINAEVKSNLDEDICVLLKISNHKWNYICECGSSSNLSVADCINTNAVFISHAHIDHIINLDTIIRHQLGIERKVTICGPKEIAFNVFSKLKGYTWNLISKNAITYEVREILENNLIKVFEMTPPHWELVLKDQYESDIIFENEILKVKHTSLDHSIPSIAYLFRENDKIKIKEFPYKPGKWIKDLKSAYERNDDALKIEIDNQEYNAKDLYPYLFVEKGCSFGIIMDHQANKENQKKIKNLFQDCDEVFIECYYRNVDYNYAIKNYHSTAKESGKVLREAGVKKIKPVHFSRRYNEEIDDLIEECMAEFENRRPGFEKESISRFDK